QISRRGSLSGLEGKSRPAPAAEPLRVERRCSRPVFCPFAIGGTAPCGGNDLPACARKRLPPPTPSGRVPMTRPCLDSSGSGLLAFAAGPRLHLAQLRAPPSLSMDERAERLCGKAAGTPLIPTASPR